MSISIHHDEQKQVFYFEEEGQRGELKYYKEGNVLDMSHTHVPESMENQGHGTALVEAALRFADEQGYQVIPSCPFVEAYFARHEAVRHLLRE